MEDNKSTEQKIDNIEILCTYLKEVIEKIRMAKSLEDDGEVRIKLGKLHIEEFEIIIKK